ncbi:MAG: hypothetical protein KC731_06700 [Myxococcales bacterium]|nr:hypothetical protein [Myxococcales bacterium]
MGRLAIFLTATTLLSCSADRSNDRIGSHLADATRTVSERVGLTLPAADTPLSLRDPGSGVAVAVRLIDATDGDLMQRRTAEGTEDFLLFDQPLPDATLRYRLVLSDAVAGLRLVAEQLELLDEGGAPRLRVKPPFVIDADGRRHAAHLALPDCASDHDPRAPQGRPVTAAGATSCTLRLAWAEGLPHPLLVDPFWTLTGSLAQARIVHTSSLLPDGKVLAMGGWDLVTTFASAEIYDPVTET